MDYHGGIAWNDVKDGGAWLSVEGADALVGEYMTHGYMGQLRALVFTTTSPLWFLLHSCLYLL